MALCDLQELQASMHSLPHDKALPLLRLVHQEGSRERFANGCQLLLRTTIPARNESFKGASPGHTSIPQIKASSGITGALHNCFQASSCSF